MQEQWRDIMIKKDGSLVVVGTGIKFLSHLTTESITHIKTADLVLYSLNEPLMEEWINANSNASSLDEIVKQSNLRMDTYVDMTDYIVKSVQKNQHVCVVFYGHPTVFAKSALDAARTIRDKGYLVKILPGISAEDCLYADLFIDPGSCGCISYEATDMILKQRVIDPTSHLIIWQVGMIGNLTHIHSDNLDAINVLQEYLLKYYDASQEVISYEAALYPHAEAKIEKLYLYNLKNMKLTSLTTLYLPPISQRKTNQDALLRLGFGHESNNK